MLIAVSPTAPFLASGPTGLGFAGLIGLVLTVAISPKYGLPWIATARTLIVMRGGTAMHSRDTPLAIWPFAAGTIGFGIAGLCFGELWLQWQFVPAGIPGRTALAMIGNGLLLAAGACLLWPVATRWAAWLLAAFYAAWAVAVHATRLFAHPLNAGVWLPVTEVLGVALGGAALALLLAAKPVPSAMRALRIALGVCALNFGICHFVYLDITASMVPGWFPEPHFWAAATGAAHLAAGASLVVGPLSRLAATMLAVMIGCFGLLVHVPRVIGTPASHMEWAMLFIAVTLSGAAWLVATGLASVRAPIWERWPLVRPADEALAG